MAAGDNDYGTLIPTPPAGQGEFCYALGVLSPMLCALDTLRLSDKTRIARARKITDPVGKAILGADSIAASNHLTSRKWNTPIDEGPGNSRSLHPAFSKRSPLENPFTSLRDYEKSDHALEVKFKRDDHTDSNEKYNISQTELFATLTALRLVKNSGIHIMGPIWVRSKASAGIPKSLGSGNPEDPALGTPRIHFDRRTLILDRSDCHLLKALFAAVMSPHVPEPITLAIKRLHFASTRAAPIDRLIDAVVGLEAIYLSETQEISYRLALRVAAHLETNPLKRSDLFQKMKAIYSARSKVLHGALAHLEKDKSIGRGRFFEDVEALCDFARDTLRLAICRVLLDCKSPIGMEAYRGLIDLAVISGKGFRPAS